jgi:hypothetical protein
MYSQNPVSKLLQQETGSKRQTGADTQHAPGIAESALELLEPLCYRPHDEFGAGRSYGLCTDNLPLHSCCPPDASKRGTIIVEAADQGTVSRGN